MKDCDRFAPLLSAFVDGELTDEERAATAAHVGGCAACRKLLDELLEMRAAFDTFEEEEVPDGFTEGVMAAVRAEKAAAKPSVKRRSVWKRYLPMAACAALVLFAAAITVPRFDTKQAANDTAALPAPESQMFVSTADASVAEADSAPEEEAFPDEYCEAVQGSSFYSALDGAQSDENGMAKSADAGSLYSCETVSLGESDREGTLLYASGSPVILTLHGVGASDYVAENDGIRDGSTDLYYVPIDALRELPDGLSIAEPFSEAPASAPENAEWVLVFPNDHVEVPQT